MTHRFEIVTFGLLAAVVVAACSVFGGRAPLGMISVASSESDPRALILTIDECNADATVEVVEESADEIVVRVEGKRSSGDDCADGVSVCLQTDLGGRPVRDDTSGTVFNEARRLPGSRQVCS